VEWTTKISYDSVVDGGSMTQYQIRLKRRKLERQSERIEERLNRVDEELLALQGSCKHPSSRKFKQHRGASRCNDCGVIFRKGSRQGITGE
jgi:hypothetical protein